MGGDGEKRETQGEEGEEEKDWLNFTLREKRE